MKRNSLKNEIDLAFKYAMFGLVVGWRYTKLYVWWLGVKKIELGFWWIVERSPIAGPVQKTIHAIRVTRSAVSMWSKVQVLNVIHWTRKLAGGIEQRLSVLFDRLFQRWFGDE